MRVDLFDFDLPPERIALRPASPRDSARLLTVDALGMADRAYVMHEGRISGELARAEMTEEAIMQLATGQIQKAA